MPSPSMSRRARCASSRPLPLSGRLVWMRAGVGVDDSLERSLHQFLGRRQASRLSRVMRAPPMSAGMRTDDVMGVVAVKLTQGMYTISRERESDEC